MLVVDMQRNLFLKIHSLDRTEIKDIKSYDTLALLNQAQEILIDKLIAEERYGDLRPITANSVVASGSFVTSGTFESGIDGAKVVDLAALTTYRTYLRSQSKLTRTYAPTVAAGTYTQNKPIRKEDVFRFETNGTNKPIFPNPRTIVNGKYLIVIPDGYSTITDIDVIYVKTPTALVISTPASDTSELPAYLHAQIVDIAVELSRQTVNINDIKNR